MFLRESSAIIKSSRPVLFCKNSWQSVRKGIQHRCFLVNSEKFLITSFLKNPLDDCFCINTRFVYCPTTSFRQFKNDVTHIFWLSIFWLHLQARNKSELTISNPQPEAYFPIFSLFAKRLRKTSSSRLARRLPRRLQDVFKTSSRRVCKTSCNYVFKTSSRRLGRQKNVTLKTSSRRLQDVFSTSSPRQMFAGLFLLYLSC